MDSLSQLAEMLETPERSLRRAVALGAIRARRPGPRRLRLVEGEAEYLRRHWKVLSRTRAALRTEPNVRMAVLAGSTARGDDRPDSDIDLVVDLRAQKPLDHMRLAMRLEEKLGRAVDVADLHRLRAEPLSLLQLLDEGRVLVDREGNWAELRRKRSALYKRAMRAYERQRKQGATALGEVAGEG